MATTTTSTTVGYQTLMTTLGDYELHHSGQPGDPESRAPPPNSRPDIQSDEVAAQSNPADWITGYRGIPPHRPINRNLDYEQRPAGGNPVEAVFIAVLLNGTALLAVSNGISVITLGGCASRRVLFRGLMLICGFGRQSISQLWSKTGQKVVGRETFKYDIGGEW